MNTDQDTTMPPGEPPSETPAQQPTPSAVAAVPAEPHQPRSAKEDDWEEEPGDDIGNRLPGSTPAHLASRFRPAPRAASPAPTNRRHDDATPASDQASVAGKK